MGAYVVGRAFTAKSARADSVLHEARKPAARELDMERGIAAGDSTLVNFDLPGAE